jgi:TolA-binding protein
VDLRQLINEYPGSAAAAEASYLIADVLEKQGRIDEAITAHTEFGKRFPTNVRGAASRLRLAELVGRTRRSDREEAQRALFAEVFNTYPRTPQALQALQLKLRLDGGRRQREMDPVLGVQVPAVVPTLRALTEQFPTNPIVVGAFARLAEAYEDLGQYARAAQAYTDLATNFPNNPHDAWFNAGEIYERRFKDMERARDAYSKVPAGSSRYRDAQRKLGNK